MRHLQLIVAMLVVVLFTASNAQALGPGRSSFSGRPLNQHNVVGANGNLLGRSDPRDPNVRQRPQGPRSQNRFARRHPNKVKGTLRIAARRNAGAPMTAAERELATRLVETIDANVREDARVATVGFAVGATAIVGPALGMLIGMATGNPDLAHQAHAIGTASAAYGTAITFVSAALANRVQMARTYANTLRARLAE